MNAIPTPLSLTEYGRSSLMLLASSVLMKALRSFTSKPMWSRMRPFVGACAPADRPGAVPDQAIRDRPRGHGDATIIPQGRDPDHSDAAPERSRRHHRVTHRYRKATRATRLGPFQTIRGGTLDFVAAWFVKAGEYVRGTTRPVGIGFVATNSITQGEQVAQLWPLLFERFRLECPSSDKLRPVAA